MNFKVDMGFSYNIEKYSNFGPFYRFKYHLVDIEFIETVSRWLNDTQVKIKTEVAASNQYAKNLFELVANFEKTVKDSKILKHREVVRVSVQVETIRKKCQYI
jgi:hypothetical protein